jgi:methyl-accepting chemotaxis protein
MKAVPSMTEEAAFAVMEKFMVVREASSDAAEKARRLREEIADTSSDHSVQYTSERTRQAIRKERDAIKGLSRSIRENREHLAAMGAEIESGIDLLKNIEEITERSKLIAFNMSIEAARLGESGRGFKVIIGELHRLNEKTFDFSRRVADLLARFREYNTLVEISSAVGRGSSRSSGDGRGETSVESLINASGRSRNSRRTASMSESIDHDLDGVLETLQFQDITRQMIEGAQGVLAILGKTSRVLPTRHGRRRRNRTFRKIRDHRIRAKRKAKKSFAGVTV